MERVEASERPVLPMISGRTAASVPRRDPQTVRTCQVRSMAPASSWFSGKITHVHPTGPFDTLGGGLPAEHRKAVHA